jgi:glycosyltransferase involved in cell wall biosynthesis
MFFSKSMNSLDKLTFSIVIPTRNESKDISITLERCLLLNPAPLEILVVDDSTDNTPQIVAGYSDRGVHLIHRSKNLNGCCGARNLGLSEAKGDIVVYLNADDRPETGFLELLLNHYHLGADYVIVKSVVINQSNLWGNYIHATNEQWLSNSPNMEWSEGFSCRREAGIRMGGIPGDFPLPFCRDWMLGDALNKAGYLKVVDLTICMYHYSPDNIFEYWQNQKWRGTFAPLNQYFFKRSSLPMVISRELLKLGRTVLKLGLIFPQIIEAAGLAKYSRRGYWDIPGLWFVGVVRSLALTLGNFKGLLSLLVKTVRK